jgi:Nucleotidyl transferase AbiEii toxin, Type IV TA system
MPQGNLTPLQSRLLELLAGMQPTWTLTGGGAIVGFHVPYRTTRDLDLFFREREELGPIFEDVQDRLRAAGLLLKVSKHSRSFARLEVADGASMTIVDLVADPIRIQTRPLQCELGGKSLQVDALQELLVNKLVAMLSRYELRDLADARALLRKGADLDLALRLAPNKDGGFSAMVLAWVLQSFAFERYRSEPSLPESELIGLETFHQELIAKLVDKSNPGDRVFERP